MKKPATTRLGGVRVGRYYHLNRIECLMVLSAVNELYWEDPNSKDLRSRGPWCWNPSPQEIYDRLPSVGHTKKGIALILREMEKHGILTRAPYRGYSPCLVPEKPWREAWDREEGGKVV